MEQTRIDRYVTDLLELSAISEDGAEGNVYVALRHLLTAVGIYEQMTDEERKLMVALKKKMQYFFSTRFSLKERKEKTKKKNIPPNPLLKEKAKKETEEKNPPTVGNAELEAFQKKCESYVGKYDQQQVANFYHYWTERDETGRMRFQNQRYFNVGTRLGRWIKNQYTANDTAAALRLQKQKKQQAVAQERAEANDRLWEQYDDMKKGAVSYEEWLASKKEHESHE